MDHSEAEGKLNFPPGPTGCMVNFATWEKFIRASDGSDDMKGLVVAYINDNVRDGDLLDSFKLGFALGHFSNAFSGDQLRDFMQTIKLTRDLNNVPIVQLHGHPVS